MTRDEQTALYRSASTLQEAQDLLAARGMPELGQYLCRLVLPNVHPDRREALLQEKALLMFAGTIPTAAAFREKSAREVAEALRWVLDVCRRGRPAALIEWSKRTGRQVTVRLVKGAYWDYETINAEQQGWPVPVWSRKVQIPWKNFPGVWCSSVSRAMSLM